MSSNSASTSRRAQKMPASEAPALNTTQPALEPPQPHNIDYLEDRVQEDANYQVQWPKWISDGKKNSFYKYVFVLLLSWHPECDDMAVEKEVQDLKSVFKDTYNYTVESVLLDSRQRTLPQVQANHAVANFVEKNDREDTLFIVYYAGHGSPGKLRGELHISGRRRQNGQKLEKQFTYINWNDVESNLKTTRADVFLIFDCCHASNLGRDAVFNARSFETLGASIKPITPPPGPESFTSALIWALQQLALPSLRSSMFTTAKLAKMIREAPNFPDDQTPSLIARDIDSWKSIILAPLPRDGDDLPVPSASNTSDDEDEEADERPIPHFLSLTFHFKAKQEEKELKELAGHLKEFMKLHDTSLHKVQWGGIWGGGQRPPPGHRFRDLVGKVMAHAQSPVSSSKTPLPSSSFQNHGLSPHHGHHPSASSTESTPLLSDTSSATVAEETTRRGIGSRLFGFLNRLWKPKVAEPEVLPHSMPPTAGTKHSRNWATRLLQRVRLFFCSPSSRPEMSP